MNLDTIAISRSKSCQVWYRNSSSTMPPDGYLPRESARQLVADGKAEYINHGRGIRLQETTDNPQVEFGTLGKGLDWDRSREITKIAIEKHPKQVVGGLVRTETKPVLISKARQMGWKPLH